METTDPTNKLIGDPKRQANDSIRGYLYQFWCTVDAWIDLGPGEIIYVEGAEDYDIVTEDKAIATQVKDNNHSGSLTLGNNKTLQVLNNYWNLRTKNPDQSIFFKYITTARVGSEQKGFGCGKGIEIWNYCRSVTFEDCEDKLDIIRQFLNNKITLDADLKSFISSETLESIKVNLVDCVEWLHAQPSIDKIEQRVIEKLIRKGEPKGLTYIDANKLAEKLCLCVADAATNKNAEELDIFSFTKLLDSFALTIIPKSALNVLDAMPEIMQTLLSKDEGLSLDPSLLLCENFSPPQLHGDIWPREELITHLKSALDIGMVSIWGSTGTGKTTLVSIALSDYDEVIWVNLRDKNGKNILRSLQLIENKVRNFDTPPFVILDDFNLPGDTRQFEPKLSQLVSVVRQKHGKLVFISYTAIPPRLAGSLGVFSETEIQINAFSKDEIEIFLKYVGCPAEKISQLGTYVWFKTSGQPQLVSAMINYLKKESYPEFNLQSLTEHPKEILDAQNEALNIAIETLSEAARDLLYRLSLAIPPLRRSHILRIGESRPKIPRTGELLTELIGPWIEQSQEDRFSVSVLIKPIAALQNSADLQTKIHRSIADSLLKERSFTSLDFSGLILHAMLGKAAPQLHAAIAAYFLASPETRVALANDIFWAVYTTENAGNAFKSNEPYTWRLFRLFQWDIARIAAPNELKIIARDMQREFADDTDEPLFLYSRIKFITSLLYEPRVELKATDVISNLFVIWEIVDTLGELGEDTLFHGDHSILYPTIRRSPVIDFFIGSFHSRIRSPEDLRDVVHALNILDIPSRKKILDGLLSDDGELRILFYAPWLSIEGKGSEIYEDYKDALETAIAVGSQWMHHAWMRAATRALSAVLDELLDRNDEAERLIVSLQDDIGTSYSLDDQLATIFFHRKDFDRATEIWSAILPNWEADKVYNLLSPILSLRLAAISAGRIGKFQLSVDFFNQAIERSDKFTKSPWIIGLQADKAYIFWQLGKKRDSVKILFDVLTIMKNVPSEPSHFAEFALHKFIGHLIGYLANSTGALHPPPIGMCSNPSPDENIRDLPVNTREHIWTLLHQLAIDTSELDVAKRSSYEFMEAPYADCRFQYCIYQLEQEFMKEGNHNIPQFAMTTAMEFEKSQERRIQKIPVNEVDPDWLIGNIASDASISFLTSVVLLSILHAKKCNLSISDLFVAWRNVEMVPDAILKLVDTCENMQNMDGDALGLVMKNPEEESTRRFVAAHLIFNREDTEPSDILYAEILLTTSFYENSVCQQCAGYIVDTLIREEWENLITNKRFKLVQPRDHVGMIRNALQQPGHGWPSAAKLILTVLPSTWLRVPSDVILKLETLLAAGSKIT